MSRLYNTFKNIFIGGAQKTTGTGAINSVEVAKNLKRLRTIKDEGFESVDKQTKGTNVPEQKKSEIKRDFGKKVSNIINPVKKAKGGRVGLKRGTGLMRTKSNVDKIKKTFGPKSLGMQSVIYGLDKNKNITASDPKAKFIAAANKKKKKKKKVI